MLRERDVHHTNAVQADMQCLIVLLVTYFDEKQDRLLLQSEVSFAKVNASDDTDSLHLSLLI